jgi:FtsZ-binding cell division protein ZapB
MESRNDDNKIVLNCCHSSTNLGCSTQREIQELRHQVYTLKQEQQKFEQTTDRLQKNIFELKREIKERDVTIQDKVGTLIFSSLIACTIILDLKNTNRSTLKKGGVKACNKAV